MPDRRSDRLRVVRVYDLGGVDAGRRILVDRLWPRGVRREALALDEWARDVAPGASLRTWFGHDPARFPAFADAYRAELDANPAADAFAARVLAVLRTEPVLLLYAARDPACNHAVVLRDWILARGG